MTENKNIVWHPSQLSEEDREKHLGQKGAVLWFTGLSGSGKSTVAHEVEFTLVTQYQRYAYTLDGDNVRHGLNKNLGFSREDRQENIRRIGEVTKLFAQANILTIASFISPYTQDRAEVRKLLPEGRFIEIFCDAPLEVCEQRDPKGLYKKVRAGEISQFTGITDPYEAPENPEIHLQTHQSSLNECVEQVISYLKKNQFL